MKKIALLFLPLLFLAACTSPGEPDPGGTTTTSSTTTSTLPPTTTTTRPVLNAESRVGFEGIGPVKVGMSLSEASIAAGSPIEIRPDFVLENCGYAYSVLGSDVGFMTSRENENDPWRIVRVDVFGGDTKTISGAHIGSTEADVKKIYGNVTVTPHKYVEGGHYLEFDVDGKNVGESLILETDGEKVTEYRAGSEPYVRWIEGCA